MAEPGRGRISLSSHFHSGCFPFPEAADGLLPGPRGSGQASGMVSPGASSFLCRAAVVARPWDLSPAGGGFIFLVMQGCCGASPGCGQRGHFHAASQASPRHSSARQREAWGGEGHQLPWSSSCASGLLPAEGPPLSESALCWSQMLRETSREARQGRATLAWGPSPGESDPGPPPGGLETSLQAFQDTCVLFFFLFFSLS